jgi:hypothetical protein
MGNHRGMAMFSERMKDLKGDGGRGFDAALSFAFVQISIAASYSYATYYGR